MSAMHNQGPCFVGAPVQPNEFNLTRLTARFGALSGGLPVNLPANFPIVSEGMPAGTFQVSFALAMQMAPAALNAANIAASQSPGAGAIVLTAGAGVTAVVVNGVTRYRLDCPRALQIVSGGNDTGINFTINGYDEYNVPVTQTQAGANIGAKNFTKAVLDVVSVTHTGSVATTVTVGTRDVIGLPYRSDLWEHLDLYYNGAIVTASTGWTVADTTDPATAATGDVRGTYALQSAADGVKKLIIFMSLPNASGSFKQLYGVTQF